MSTTRIDELRAQLTAATNAVSLDSTEPIVTSSGVERGRALYDQRSPQPESDALGRSRRTRRSTERGIAWAQDVEQSKAISAKIRRTKERKARRASMSASGSADELDEVGSQAASQAPATQDGKEPTGESQYETVAFIPREKLLEKLAQKINIDCTGLTTQEILDLLDAPGLSDDQTAPMEAEDEHLETFVLPPTRVSVGGGFHLNSCATNGPSPSNSNPLPVPAVPNPPSNHPINPLAENTDTEDESDDDPTPPRTSAPSQLSTAPPSKRACSPLKSQPPPKRSRIVSAENTDTEPEVEEVPPPYQVPRSRASTGTVIPDSQPVSPNPSATMFPNYLPLNPLEPMPPPDRFSQRSHGGAVSATSSPSLGAPRPSLDSQKSRNLDTLSRMSSISLGDSIPTFGAQPHEATHHASESQSQPRRGPLVPLPASQSRRESQAPSQALPTVSREEAPRSSATALHHGVPSSEQPMSSAIGLDPNVPKPVSDKLADTRERLHKLVSVIIGRKEPEHDSSATNNQPSSDKSSSIAATISAQPSGRGEIMPDDEEERRISAARTKGKRIRRRKKNKPLTSDFEGRARQVIIMAKLLLFTYVVVFGPYLTRETYMAWAPLIYELAWYREYPELPYELPPKGVYEVMVDNLSSLKGSVKLALRNVVMQVFKKLRRPALTPEAVEENLKVLREIYPNHFHCIDPQARRGHYQGEIMAKAISAAFFHGPHAIGILFHNLFDPIPIPTICFILANLQFCVEEWSTGHFKATDLNLGNMPEKYLCHVHNLGNFRRVAELDRQLWEKRREWFKHAVAFSGASHTDKIESSKYIIDISEFRPDSPRPQPQPEHAPALQSEVVPEHEPGWGAGPSTA